MSTRNCKQSIIVKFNNTEVLAKFEYVNTEYDGVVHFNIYLVNKYGRYKTFPTTYSERLRDWKDKEKHLLSDEVLQNLTEIIIQDAQDSENEKRYNKIVFLFPNIYESC